MKQHRTIVERATDDFLRHLREKNASPHTIKAYTGDLDTFAAYIGERDWKTIDHIAIRGFLSHLYDKGLSKTSVARALAAVRSLYRWLAQEGIVEQNSAKLVSTPRLPKKMPRAEAENNAPNGSTRFCSGIAKPCLLSRSHPGLASTAPERHPIPETVPLTSRRRNR